MGWLVALVLAGTVTAGCSDNNGRATPTSADTTGFANTSADINIFLGINPSSITPGQRAGVTAVVTNSNGQPLAGKTVQFSTTVGSLDSVSGTTNSKGQFSTFLRISQTDALNCKCTSADVTAVVDGKPSPKGTVSFGTAVQLVIIPDTTTVTVGADIGGSPAVPGGGSTPAIPATPNNRCSAFSGFTVSFTVSGGQPPYTFSTAGAYPGARISANGVYTAPTLPGPFGVGQSITDTVTVKDSLGVTAPATITVSCVSAPAA